MRRSAVLVMAVFVAGCGGGTDTQAEKVHQALEQATTRLHERVAQETKTQQKPDTADRALLQIERSSMPEDVKQQLLEAKELLDKIDSGK